MFDIIESFFILMTLMNDNEVKRSEEWKTFVLEYGKGCTKGKGQKS